MQAGKEKLESQIKGSELSIVREEVFGEECTYARMDELAEEAKASEADMIFGMGGGKALDTAKGTAEKAGLPVFTFPTIAATCAATTALSVVYREDGNFDSFYFFENRHATALLIRRSLQKHRKIFKGRNGRYAGKIF